MPLTINLPNIPNLPISPLAVIHFGFTSLVLLYLWIPQYMFVHTGLILFILWAAHDKRSALAVIMYIISLLISFVTDVISIAYYFRANDTPRSVNYSLWQFTAAVAIMHLLAKPLMGLYALILVLARRDSLKFSLTGEYSNIDAEGGEENH